MSYRPTRIQYLSNHRGGELTCVGTQPRVQAVEMLVMFVPSARALLKNHPPHEVADVIANWLEMLGRQLFQLGVEVENDRWRNLGLRAQDLATQVRK